jgi:ribosomal-protein-alanine N-acetyltransferase
VQIRHATSADLPPIRDLERQTETAAHWSDADYDALFAPDAPRRIALIIATETQPQQINGFVIARCNSDEWEIENVIISRDLRHQGMGSALIRELLNLAKKHSPISVLLEVRESNLAARRLYETLGFSQVGRRKNYYRDPSEDALMLKISISVS